MPLNTQAQYEQLPYLETVTDVAEFVIRMVTDKQQIYMDGIRDALKGMEFSTAQIGLLDKYASSKLSKKLDAHLCGEHTEAIPAHLEKAFWAPMAAMSAIVVAKPLSTTT